MQIKKSDIIRYIIGGFLIFANVLEIPKLYSFFGILFGISLFPIFYHIILDNKASKTVILLFSIFVPILLFMLWAGTLSLSDNTNENPKGLTQDSNIQDNNSDNIQEQNKKEILKIDSKDYAEYVSSITKNYVQNNDVFKSRDFSTHRYPYIKVSFYTNKKVDGDSFGKEYKNIVKKLYQDLTKKNYEKGSFWKYNYDYINVYFYNYENGRTVEQGFIQINILEINDFKTFEDFFNYKYNLRTEKWN